MHAIHADWCQGEIYSEAHDLPTVRASCSNHQKTDTAIMGKICTEFLYW